MFDLFHVTLVHSDESCYGRHIHNIRLRAALPKGWRVLRATNKQTVKIHYILSPQVNCNISNNQI